MRQILIPIDPSNEARTRSAIAEAVNLYRQEPVHIRLLRVQPRLTAHVAMFFGDHELHQLQQQTGAEELQFAKGLLDAAGVPNTSTVRIGRSAPTIVAVARELGCDRIIFGQAASGRAGSLFGSLAQQVRHLMGPNEAQVLGS